MNKAGLPFVLGAFGVAIVLFAIWYALRWEPWRVLATLAGIFGLFCLWFFRDPVRVVPVREGAIISPADGKVVEIVTENDPYVGPGARRVSVFLSVFDVHVNRVPITGEVTAVKYNPGKFLVAFAEKASEVNEQTHIAIKSTRGTVAFKQIAGLIARRIICTLEPGEMVVTGERCGLIRFGSRVDIIMPPDARVLVKIGERVRGGESVIGEFR